MLTIRNEQMLTLKNIKRQSFEKKMLLHLEQYFPRHWRVLGEDILKEVIHLGSDRAQGYGLRTEYSICRYIGLMLYLGSYFDEDPQLPWAREILNDKTLRKIHVKIEKLMLRSVDYLNEVHGPQAELLLSALEKTKAGIPRPQHLSEQKFSRAYLLSILQWLFPEKYQVLDQKSLHQITEQCFQDLADYNFSGRNGAVAYLSLMFLLGAGFANDPQFRWAGATIMNQQIPEYKNRVLALDRQIITHAALWLD